MLTYVPQRLEFMEADATVVVLVEHIHHHAAGLRIEWTP
jgi:hypothetical protein